MKKEKTNKIINSILINLQVVCTVVAIILFIIFIFKREVWIYLGLLLGFSLFLMAYNNYVIYKKKYMTIIFTIMGLLLVVYSIVRM
ncbi:MAG: hypothetical protein MR031_02255 [Tenericutes bacterium]|nr:hypothetical protein [Mycoplasmatota bacterium]